MTERRHHFEIWSVGIDEQIQGVGGDAFGGNAATGLRVPTLASTPEGRYLFMLCGFGLGEGSRATIVGWRQLLTLGAIATLGDSSGTMLIEQEVTSPVFRFPDGNVSWHLVKVGPELLESLVFGLPPFSGIENLAWRMSQTPALLAETITLPALDKYYVDLTAYVPPNLGHPYGDSIGQCKTIHDLRANWRDDHAWSALNIPVEGPGFFCLFASVKQTAGVALTAPTNAQGTSPEYQFISNYPSAIYWRVGGALSVEMDWSWRNEIGESDERLHQKDDR
jgi:hypothetical protein